MSEKKRFLWEFSPKALNENIVKGKCYRFTVLTDFLIRMEYSETGIFEDRATQTVFFRDFPKCDYAVTVNAETLVIETKAMILTYIINQPFNKDTLNIELKIEPYTKWCFGNDLENLGGTAKTLDNADGEIPIGDGVCSKKGIAVLDDSDKMPLGNDGWITVRDSQETDCYVFCYGFNYIGAVKDFYRLTGAPSLLPAYALGNWWSRYYAYTQQEYLELMDKFKENGIPFSVGVIDMDWHITKIPEELKDTDKRHSNGWTGYSWNKELFPNYKEFLKNLHERNLKTSLNLHPASGVGCHEDMYTEMAIANNIDPKTKQRVYFDVLSKEFMQTYFDILHHPYEQYGVDFWWMDWQQGTNYWWIHDENLPKIECDPREQVDPLWLLNHLHILDIMRDGNKRPMFFSRYSGPGSHRYPVGFSGDTYVTWESLKFQPKFTATASNIGYSWWSHDIGGHHLGYRDDELYIRWLQLGVFSPINRLHSTKSRWLDKAPWNYKEETERIAAEWLQLRHRLFPYIYTMNYRNHSELLPLVQPMYYSHPKCEEAYLISTQFWFGSELVVSPIIEKNDNVVDLGKAEVWIPKGDWFDFFDGTYYSINQDKKFNVYRSHDVMPVFAKAGAIIPMANYEKGDNRLFNCQNMQVLVFPGADNSFFLYEDAGEGDDYKKGAFAKTEMQLSWGQKTSFTIKSAQGDLSLIPAKRKWKIGLRGYNQSINLNVLINNKSVFFDVNTEPQTNTVWVTVDALVTDNVVILIDGKSLMNDNADVLKRCEKLLISAQCRNTLKDEIWGLLLNRDKFFIKQSQNSDEKLNALFGAINELLTLK